jgi:DNA-binding LacI/PurR family transcriptional regulator
MVDSVMYLAEKGFSKIGYVYANYFQDAPQNIGYKEGLKKAGLEFEPTINLYIHNSDWFFERLLNNHNDFDALIVESHMQIKQTMFLLEKSGRRIPDDIGVMVIGDHEKLQYYTPPITALATPHHECGKKIIKSIIKDKIESKTIDLTAKIFERDSTQKGIGSAPNPAFNIAPQAEANFYL